MPKIFAIGDLHLSVNNPKPMDVFGGQWENYWEKICADWGTRVAPDDIVLIPGDISWAMYLENAVPDLALIGALPGKKVILRGNHDYWWKSISAVRGILPDGMLAVQNDAVKIGGAVIFGSRLWMVPETPGVFDTPEDKTIYLREIERLKLSVAAALRLKKDGDRLICMAHSPPFNARKKPSDYTDIIEQSGASACAYGHLHGRRYETAPYLKNGVTYYLTSCDTVDNKLVEIS